jgi:copper chaperone
MQIRLKVDGMTCGGCVRAVQTVLSRMDKVYNVAVDLAAGEAVVSAQDGIDAAALIATVEDAGYEARQI